MSVRKPTERPLLGKINITKWKGCKTVLTQPSTPATNARDTPESIYAGACKRTGHRASDTRRRRRRRERRLGESNGQSRAQYLPDAITYLDCPTFTDMALQISDRPNRPPRESKSIKTWRIQVNRRTKFDPIRAHRKSRGRRRDIFGRRRRDDVSDDPGRGRTRAGRRTSAL